MYAKYVSLFLDLTPVTVAATETPHRLLTGCAPRRVFSILYTKSAENASIHLSASIEEVPTPAATDVQGIPKASTTNT